MRIYNKLIQDAESIAAANNSDAYQLESIYGYAIQLVVSSVTTPSNLVAASATDISSTNDTFTKVNHGFATGLKVALTTSSVLPTGLSATNYYIIKVDANTVKLATSAVNALAGTAVDFTTNGTGNQTLTPASLASCIVKLQATCDNASDSNVSPTWTDLASPQAITSTGNYLWNVADSFYSYVRVNTDMTAGQITLSTRINAKGV